MSTQLIAVVGDIHHTLWRLDEILEEMDGLVDLWVATGDIGPNLLPWGLRKPKFEDLYDYKLAVQEVLNRFEGKDFVFVPGNHCDPNLGPFKVESNIDRRTVQKLGLTFWGCGGSPKHVGHPYEWGNEGQHGPPSPYDVEGVDIILAHSPPYMHGDRTVRGDSVGSLELLRLHEENPEALYICGHIHEAHGVHRLNDRTVLNAGALGKPHGKTHMGLVEVVDGRWQTAHFGSIPYIKEITERLQTHR